MRAASEKLYEVLVQGEPNAPALDTGSAIVTAALLAGTRLFRNTGLDLASGIEPGGYVLIDSLNDQGIELLNRFEAQVSGLRSEAVAVDDRLGPLEGTGPTASLLELVQTYEPAYDRIRSEAGVSDGESPEMAILAAALIVHRASEVMDADTGKAIVVQALVHSCKTAPPPRPS